jgi:hypothetical protein
MRCSLFLLSLSVSLGACSEARVVEAQTCTNELIDDEVAELGETSLADVGPDAALTAPLGAIELQPGDDVAAIVEAAAPGETFFFHAGVYREIWIEPKNGQSFLAERGASLNGARRLKNFSQDAEGLWYADEQTQEAMAHGGEWCHQGYEGCHLPEGLWIDGEPLRQVTSKSDVKAGRFYFDYGADRIYFADDPCGREVEASVTYFAFSGVAADVTVKGFLVEHYSNPSQFAAIMGEEGARWTVERNEVRHSHGAGIAVPGGSVVAGNFVHHIGQIGLVGGGDDVLVEGNEISYNNLNRFSVEWECGGSKFTVTNRLIVRGNLSHHNFGPGLWTDIDNIDTLYEDNVVEYNEHAGIFHEISYAAEIRNNIVRYNGRDDAWLWGAQILIAASQDVDVHDNVVTVAAGYGDGISLIQQDRGLYLTRNNSIHDNVINFLGEEGMAGGVSDLEDVGHAGYAILHTGNNVFRDNAYHVHGGDGTRWMWDTGAGDGEYDLTGIQGLGQEIGSTLQVH